MIATRPLGTSGCNVPVLGFGAAPLGNLFHRLSDAMAHETLAAALDAGLRYVDTAPHYGRGLSERRVGDVVRGRSDVTVSTKVGRLMNPDASIRDDKERDGFLSPMPFRMMYDYSHDGILRSHEASLHRLGLGRVDILYVHDIGRLTHGDRHDHYWHQLTSGGGLRALERLREERSIGGFGIGVNEVAVCLDVMAEARLDAILLAGRYTLLEHTALDTLFPACALAGTAVVIGGPYNSGILATGTNGPQQPYYDYAPAVPAIIERVKRFEMIADRHQIPLASAALQFPLAHPVVAAVIPGLGSPARVQATVALMNRVIPQAFWAELKAEELLPHEAPV
jgi:D-threo-aldose 1-dehydrogenase